MRLKSGLLRRNAPQTEVCVTGERLFPGGKSGLLEKEYSPEESRGYWRKNTTQSKVWARGESSVSTEHRKLGLSHVNKF